MMADDDVDDCSAALLWQCILSQFLTQPHLSLLTAFFRTLKQLQTSSNNRNNLVQVGSINEQWKAFGSQSRPFFLRILLEIRVGEETDIFSDSELPMPYQ